MKVSKIIFALFCAFVCMINVSIAQSDNHTISISVPTVTMLRVAPTASKNITMNFTAPGTAGDAISTPTNNSSLYLQYSSILNTGVTSRTIYVKSTAMPTGISIGVTAANAGGVNLLGQPGTGSTVSALATSDASLISGITSCATGSSGTDGSNLTYSLTATTGAYANIRAGSATVTVTYTLADD